MAENIFTQVDADADKIFAENPKLVEFAQKLVEANQTYTAGVESEDPDIQAKAEEAGEYVENGMSDMQSFVEMASTPGFKEKLTEHPDLIDGLIAGDENASYTLSGIKDELRQDGVQPNAPKYDIAVGKAQDEEMGATIRGPHVYLEDAVARAGQSQGQGVEVPAPAPAELAPPAEPERQGGLDLKAMGVDLACLAKCSVQEVEGVAMQTGGGGRQMGGGIGGPG